MRIGIFGGTFNPPHKGHRHIAEDFRNHMADAGLPLDKVLVIPTCVPPHKVTPDLASGEDRLAMCRLAFEDFNVSDYEVSKADVSYTYMTLAHLHELYDDVDPVTGEKTPAELYFLMGDDMLLYLPKWMRPEKILEDAVLVSTIRSRDCSLEELETFARETYPAQYAAGRFLFLESDPILVSSTEVRALLKEPGAEARQRLEDVMDPAVLTYILERRLYQ